MRSSSPSHPAGGRFFTKRLNTRTLPSRKAVRPVVSWLRFYCPSAMARIGCSVHVGMGNWREA